MPETPPPSPLWNATKSSIQSLFPAEVFQTWFEPVRCLVETTDHVVLTVPNEFSLFWMQDNYEDLIRRKLGEIADQPIALTFKVEATTGASGREEPPPSAPRRRVEPAAKSSTSGSYGPDAPSLLVNPRNTFANFVVGPANQLAHAASIAVANAPSKAYNPLFLYGETGLGKTHLMHAIAQQIASTQPGATISYVSTETFTNQYIEAIRSNTAARFRQRYRKVNVLLIDDVQFLEGKEGIQEEIFHTFNDLHEQNRQIVLTSDRPASEIAKLETRLLSRFQWGLVADIQAPDLETRIAIFRKKAEAMNLHLPEPVLRFLGEKVSRNVRRMEGALNRVAGLASLMQETLDVSSLTRLLSDILADEAQERLSMAKIQQRVADQYKMKIDEMISRSRRANVVLPRQIAMYLARQLTSHSLAEIGTAFGKRDHGTVIHAIKTVENLMAQEPAIKRTVDYLHTQLASRP